MDTKLPKQLPADAESTFDLSKYENQNDTPIEKKAVTFWMPKDLMQKYELIQKRSKRKFGKHLTALLMKSIAEVKIEESEAS